MAKLVIFVAFAFVGVCWGYSGGAPEAVCEDMIPKHPVEPQKSPLPYTVKVDKESITAKDRVKIVISGDKPFKGYLMQVRNSKGQADGTFNVDAGDRYSKTINCFAKKQNAVTHKNSADKNGISLEWAPPANAKGTYTVYVTVAEDGGVFWTAKPTAKITVS